MSIESTIYSPGPAISLSQLREAALQTGVELRAFDPDDTTYRLVSNTEIPLDDAWYVLLAWPRKDAETTKVVDEAMARGDKPTVDRLGMTGKLGWFEFSCTTFDYER